MSIIILVYIAQQPQSSYNIPLRAKDFILYSFLRTISEDGYPTEIKVDNS